MPEIILLMVGVSVSVYLYLLRLRNDHADQKPRVASGACCPLLWHSPSWHEQHAFETDVQPPPV